ncbi:MAG: hypothetical protein JWO94_1943 [Verrucomicrobiaceae bacterium]|nr:hypothetical protein [Verrucomicrobiaceae bacterium]
MRGSPPVQLAFLLLGFFVVGVPLVQLTHGRTQAGPQAAPHALSAAVTPVFIRLRYSQKPLQLVLKDGSGHVLTPAGLAASPVEIHTQAIIPPEGLEFFLSAEWPPETPETAVTVEIEPDALQSRSQTRWSLDGRIEDTVAFTWK